MMQSRMPASIEEFNKAKCMYVCNAAQCDMPAGAQKRANCDAAKETSYLTQFATNCIFATDDR
jgi:hypothetical protein